MTLYPVTLREANAFVRDNHRHHGPVQGHKFSIGIKDGDYLVGVAIVGRPVARFLDNGTTAEVTRLCTDGTRNACSMLYSAAARAARAMGYMKIISYTLLEETGASLKAAGFSLEGISPGGSWNHPNRQRTDKAPTTPKKRWAKNL